jgi:hypothetical protein
LRAFTKLWVKRIKCADKAEMRVALSSVSIRGSSNRKRRLEDEWLQCSNPSCGKWRSVAQGLDTKDILRKLNLGKWGLKNAKWYCSMNNWDETTASCSAPQEPLYDCPWNLESSSTSEST